MVFVSFRWLTNFQDVKFLISSGLSHLFSEDSKAMGLLLSRYLHALSKEYREEDDSPVALQIDKLLSILQCATRPSDIEDFYDLALNDFAKRTNSGKGVGFVFET